MGNARMSLDPNKRTMGMLQSHGWLVELVERRERYATYDAFGCFDVLAIAPRGQVLLVQCTSIDHVAGRVTKCMANSNTRELLLRGVWCEVWGWREEKPDPRRVHMAIEGSAVLAREGAT